MLGTILLVFAFVLLVLAAFNVPTPPRVNLGVAWVWPCACLSILRVRLPALHRSRLSGRRDVRCRSCNQHAGQHLAPERTRLHRLSL